MRMTKFSVEIKNFVLEDRVFKNKIYSNAYEKGYNFI